MENTPAATPPSTPTPVTSVVKKFPKFNLKASGILIAGVVLVILAGIGTGWLLSGARVAGTSTQDVPGAATGPKEAGLADEKTFRDTAEGTLEEGGIAGEGTHHLVRDGGPSQNVYLTSTTIDLTPYVGKKIQVWGETLSGVYAGWLMDVVKVKELE